MPRIKEDIFKDINFSSINDAIVTTLQNSLEQFWAKDSLVSLQAINDFDEFRQEKIIKGIDFFSSKINVENYKPVTIRLSKGFIENYLNATFSSNLNIFNLSSLTPLEIKILNNFSEYLYKNLKEVLIPQNNLKISERSEKIINLIFAVSFSSTNFSYITISLPFERLKVEKLNKKVSFNDECFKDCHSGVNIKVGSSKVTLEELQSLSCDDIIILENSSLTKMTLLSGEFEKDFKVKIDSSLIMEQDEFTNNDEIYDEVTMEKNLWDDIQIEINAEFEKVKMTIGELKQITQGQIIDLGSVFKNEISLFVEDKKVAKGELIIINDRYAVRLNEVLSQNTQTEGKAKETEGKNSAPENKPQATPQAKPANPATKAAPKPQPKPTPKKPENEEFDYSDFEK